MVATNRFDDRSRPVEVRLEYLKRRRVLRLWPDRPALEPIEVHRSALLEAVDQSLAASHAEASQGGHV